MSGPYSALSKTWQAMPTNLDAESALLGGLLHNNRAIDRCAGLKAEHFAGEHLGAVYTAICEGIANGHIVDAVSLKREFAPDLLTSLLASMVGIINLNDYARVIRETAEARAWIAAADAIADAARSGRPLAEINAMAAGQIDMMTGASGRQWTLNEAMDDALAAMERATAGHSAGVTTGFKCFDERLGGLEPGLVYVVAGRPGMGKSSIGHQIALNAARAGTGVLELSLEMSARQLGRRALSSASGIPLNRLKRGELDLIDADRVVRARKELTDLPITIDDTAGQTPAQIAMKARGAKRQHGIGLVMIDHLNLMAVEEDDARHGGNWATERASGTVLQIAKDLECPVLLLAQLNRGVEGREDKRPILSDLRQAGAIEQDAYAVGFVYRPEYYQRDCGPEKKDGETDAKYADRKALWYAQREQQRGTAELIWAKVRDGQPGTDKLRFDAETTTFGEIWS